MTQSYLLRFHGIVLLASIAFHLAPPAAAQTSNGVLREVYSNIGGNSVADLTSHPSYPGSPSLETIQPTFEAPNEFSDNYGQRMRALLIPPVTGSYTFWIASDDGGALYLSTNEDPANRILIATVNAWTASREWNKEANQKSAPINLTNGFRYYIEALQKEGGGGDNLAVTWQKPGDPLAVNNDPPIASTYLVPVGLGPPIISQQPTNVSAVEGAYATFNVALSRMLGAAFQWSRNSTNVPGATNAAYSLGPVVLGDSGSTFRCAITNSLGITNSAVATLTVVPDTTKPTITTVGNIGENQIVFVVFSEPVEEATATNATNYTVSGGITVTRAVFGVDTRTIILTTTTLAPNVTYTLTVNNVRDRATTPNTILANSQRTFAVVTRPIDIGYLSLPKESPGPSSRRHGVVISEVMYHPTNRPDARNLEFIEIFNSQPWFEELGGWRISGAIDYVFPSNVVLASRSYLVVAASPADFRATYSFTNVLGPFVNSNALQNSSGTLRLRNNRDAVLFEMTYTGDPPYPAAADGAGHSLVLARPSYGERDPRAWAASELIGGNPGAADAPLGNTLRTLLINEFLAHTDLPAVDFIELYNYGASALNIGGCVLTDDGETNKFVIPANTIISPRGFLAFTEAQLGFSLDAGGETIFLKNNFGNRILDAIRFDALENGVATGRYPDGATAFTRLATPTPGTNNAPLKRDDVVINEIMFDPVTDDANDEYLELFNRGTNDVDLGGWRIRDGVTFNIPNGTILPMGGYLVIARDAARLRTNYAGLTIANCLGDYGGSLANGGERVELNKPDEVAGTNAMGQLVTNKIHITVDEVTYGPGGRWGKWVGGGGSSLELRDVRADNRLAPNWADSDESAKSQWITVETTGVMDNGWADAYQLHVTLLGAGEALVDNIEVIPAGGANVIANGTFETDASGWVFQGNHNQTGWEPGEGFASSRSLHLRATGRGDSGANRVRAQLPATLAPGTTVTLRAKVRWLKGNPNILLRLRGNWLESIRYTLTARNLGTPGAVNSRAAANAGPAITDVRHDPPLPAASQAVLVVARVSDPDGLAFLAVNYRIDPNTNYTAVAMTNNGAGFYSTTIPGQAAGAQAAFYVSASDNFTPTASGAFPNDAPARECVVRWGDTTIPGTLGTYRMWLTQTNVDRWSNEERMSNNAKDVTFLYGTNRIVYNAGGWFHGSPYHSPSYNSPVGNSCDYDMSFPPDERFLGETDINLFRPGNGGGDGTAQAEIHGYWFGGQFGAPFLYNRTVFIIVNGQRRETVFLDAQQPNGDFVEQWYPDDPDGDLHKIQIGFEFGDQAYGVGEPGFAGIGSSLNRWTTTGGVKKQAVYRAILPRRAAAPTEQNDYTNLFALIETVLTNAPINSDAYTTALTGATDVEEWYRVHVTQHLFNNGDSFSYGGGQNAFIYGPERDTWKLFLWDIDFAFGGSPTDGNLFGIGGADHGPRNDHAPFTRIYWQTLIEAARGFMTAARSNPILDARYNGMVAGGAGVGSPQYIKDFIAARREFILQQVTNNQSAFAITSNGGADFATNRNLITLTGTAPLEVRTILINGVPFPVSWTSLNTWVIRVPLTSGTNMLAVTGVDPRGALVAGVGGTFRVNYTGAVERPEDRLVINEIMYNPAVADASYVEIFNTSASNVFDMSRWRLEGTGFTFPVGTIIEAGTYLVVAKDQSVFAATYGVAIPVAGEFPGQLDNGGETLKLIKPGATAAQDKVIDQMTYDDDLPWPAAADGGGSSLQLIDALQDNNRAANWGSVSLASSNPPQSLISITQPWKYQQTQDLTLSNWTAVGYNDAAWPSGPALLYVETAALPAPKSTALTIGRITYYFRTHFTFNGSLAGASLKLFTVLDDGAVFYLNGQELYRIRMPGGAVNYSTITSGGIGDATYEGPFLLPGSALVQGDNVLAVEVHQSSPGSSDIVFGMTLDTTYDVINRYTPGVANSLRATMPAFPPLWLNEVLPNNFFLGTNGITDSSGERDPWVELYNGGTNELSLNGYYLANNYTNLTQWPFPSNAVIAAKQFLIVWLDGQPAQSTNSELHANFRAAPDVGSVALSKGTNLASLIDHLNYEAPVAGRSHGSYPDGNASGRREFSRVTPGATNNPASTPIRVFINEWMADNAATLCDTNDPAGANCFDDWIELFNPGPNAVNLGGYFLADSLTNATQWEIPSTASIPPGGFLLVWADGDTDQNGPGRPDLHASFSLARTGGEAIALFAPDGTIIDGIAFGAQATDVSQGRFPDGQPLIFTMTNATPRTPNLVVTGNSPPVLAHIGDRTVNEGALLTFNCVATDTNVPAQTLTFSLGAGTPQGSSMTTNGVYTWTPAESQGPGTYAMTIRVADNGSPPLIVTETITITVNEVNNAPLLASLNGRSIAEGSLLLVTNTASDPDPGAHVLVFSLDPGFPAGMTINPTNGLISWVPAEDQGPGTHSITVRVTDDGDPPLSTARTFSVTVNEVNAPPTLAFPALRLVHAESPLAFTAQGGDTDLPAQFLTYEFDVPPPAGVVLDANTGAFTWTPPVSAIGTNLLPLRVRDSGSPRLSTPRTLTVVVMSALQVTITRVGTAVTLTVPTIAGRTYRAEHTDSLPAGSWTRLETEKLATGATLNFQDDINASQQRFYRVRQMD